MNRLWIVTCALAGCSHGIVKSAGFTGQAPEPAFVVAPLDCVAPAGRDRDEDRVGRVFGNVFVAKAGGGKLARLSERAVCPEYGVRMPMFGHTPDTVEAIRETVAATGARSLLVPIVQRDLICHNQSLAIRDASGAPVGSIDTGDASCRGGVIELRLYLFDASGELLWRKFTQLRSGDTDDVASLEGKATWLMSELPIAVTAGTAGASAPAPAPAPAAAPAPAPTATAVATLPDGAPAACAATWKTCDALEAAFAQQCHSVVINAVRYGAASAADTCRMLGEQMKSLRR